MRYARFAAAVGLALAFVMPARAEVKSVTGELISIMCFKGNGEKGRGDAHVSCAIKCAKEGYALGVLTDEGVIYKIVGAKSADNNAALQPLLGKTVVATGELGQDGDDQTIDVQSVAAATK